MKKSTKAVTATQRAYTEIKRRIIEGILPEGAPIRQDEVASDIGVSKIPVREALMRLSSEGFVNIATNTGATVAVLNVDDYVEMLDIRIALECRALELAVPNMVSSDFAQARKILEAYEKAPDEHEWSDLNMAFHESLYAPANRPRLITLTQSVQDHMGRILRLRVTMAAERERSHQEHLQLLIACERGDVKEAVNILRNHIEQTQKEVRGYFRNVFRERVS